MFHSKFKECHHLDHTVNENSPELNFLRYISNGGKDAQDFFQEKTANNREVCLYTPGNKYCGIEEIKDFPTEWFSTLGASTAEVHPVIQTVAGGRSVSEVEVWFDIGVEEPLKIPMALFADLAPHGKLEGLRFYYFYQWIPGTPAYHRPIYRPTFNTPSETHQLSGIIRHYYEQLHNPYTPEALKNIIGMMADDFRFGGYRPFEVNPPLLTMEEFRKKYEHTTSIIPADQYIRFETVTDDGRNCLVEWTSIVRKHALAKGIVSQAGMAAYERNDEGKLVSIRICDNFGWEEEIDYSTVLPENQFIDA